MPTHSEAMRNVAPPLKRKRSLAQITAWLENDATWKPAYKLMVSAVLTVWITAALLVTAFLCERNTMNTDPTAASARARLADGGK